MRRRSYAFSLATTFAVLTLLASPRSAAAQDLAGTYRVTTDQTTVQIPEWGSDCGPRPSSRTGNVGREATVTSDGSQLTIQDGRHRNRTDGCWSDNPSARRISASHTGNRWSIVCQTPDSEYQHEQGTYTITVDGAHITMRESTEYSWQLRESRCRASASRTLAYERTSGAATPPPVVDAGSTHATTPPPPARCATVGAPARLTLAPARRSLAPGGRGCFRARFLDPNGCEVSSGLPPIVWTMTRASGTAPSADAVMESGCVRAPTGLTVGEFNVTATAGPLSASGIAAVVSAEELQNLVAANFEDETPDAGAADSGPAITPSGSGVGAVVVQAPPPPPAPGSSFGPLLWGLMALGGLLAIAGVALLAGRRKPARPSRAPERVAKPNAVATGKELSPVKRQAEPPPMLADVTAPIARSPAAEAAAPVIAPVGPAYVQAARPLVKRCPQCDQRFTFENAFCPEHGVALVSIEGMPVGNATAIAGSAGRGSASSVCARCGQPVEAGAQFCPRDGTPILAPTPPAPSAPAAALPLVCPRCQRRFADGTTFCGEDGSPLARG